jgi:hypothetical protein
VSDKVRLLNEMGIARFKEFLDRVRGGSTEALPAGLLTDEATSEPIEPTIEIKICVFTNRYELGIYLAEILKPLDRHQISRDHRLWNWLALFFFDTLCKKEANGTRKLLRSELYILEKKYDYLRYYKHLVRTPWLAVLDLRENAQILFANSRGTRSDIEETLTASQQVLGNSTIIAVASKLYFDVMTGKPKRGAAGKSAGSPRRLTAVIQQLERTFDIQSCTPEQFLELLPHEFDKFKTKGKVQSHALTL